MNKHFVNPVFEEIWKDRYCKNGETYEHNLLRVAEYCSNTEEEKDAFYDVMKRGEFFPGGRTMSNAGIGEKLTLNNCFVAPAVQDSMDDIFAKVALGARTHQRGGGIGYDFSDLRPAGEMTSNDAVASGPVSFMDVFNAQTATILQGNRRGANMGVLSVYHPDIEEFLEAKASDPKRLCHFNLSVMVDDAFMEAAERGDNITLHWPVYNDVGYIEHDESKWKVRKTVNAKELWEKIIRKAYDNGEPGVLFYDAMNELNPLYYTERIRCTNPCAEYLSGTVYGQELPSSAYGGACNLGSLMIHNFVADPFGDNAHIDWERLTDVIFTAVRMLDNIIDKNQFPHEIYENYQKTFRTIGLGVTGLADALCMLGLRYNSAEARDFTDRLMNYIAHEAYAASMLLAEEKGTFPGYKKEYLSNEFLMSHVGGKYRWDDLCAAIKEHGIRNAKLLAVAPTGTMSIVFGNNCSSGIEPIFSLGYDRKVKIGAQTDDAEQTVTVEDYAYHLYKEMGIECKDDVFRTALNISVEDHLAMLGTIARHVDMSVSKTINIPTEYSFEDTKEVYEKAWKLGIKGCTIFRPNALRPGIFNTSKKEDEHYNTADEIPRGMIEDVPQNLTYQKHKIKTGCGSLYLFVGVDENDGKIYDFFTNTDGVGGCTVSTQANSRLMSAALRGGVPVEYIIEQLQKSGSCPSYQYARGKGKEVSKGKSCPSAIAYVLQSVVDSLKAEDDCDDGCCETVEKVAPSAEGGVCPECGENEVVHEGGCLTCRNCGWSKCS